MKPQHWGGRQEVPWGRGEEVGGWDMCASLLAIQSSPLGEFQGNERPCFKKDVDSSKLSSGFYAYIHVYACAHTYDKQTKIVVLFKG